MTKFVNFAILIGTGVFFAAPTVTFADEPLTVADAKKLKNPVPYSKKSISEGRSIYMRNCTACHGADAKATVDVVADATDLTSPNLWKNGTTEGEIFRSIREGQGASMPTFKAQIKEEDIWHLVNYIRSLWPESKRPSLSEDDKGKSN